MYFCEKCNLLSENDVCGKCGMKELREVQNDDFCFYISLPSGPAQFFEENLKLYDIPVAMLGRGLNLRNRTSGEFDIFIPYGCFIKADEVYAMLWGED